MSLSDRLQAFTAWLVGPRGLMALAAGFLFVLMSASFVNIPWNLPACGGDLCEVPVSRDPGGVSIADALFGPYVVLVVLSALVLASCMVGGVYLAKAEGGRFG